MIPVVDIFAGPGGLGEGFSSVLDRRGRPAFEIVLSVEKDPRALEKLRLRTFFRQFPPGRAPEDYYRFVRAEIPLAALYAANASTSNTWTSWATTGPPPSSWRTSRGPTDRSSP